MSVPWLWLGLYKLLLVQLLQQVDMVGHVWKGFRAIAHQSDMLLGGKVGNLGRATGQVQVDAHKSVQGNSVSAVAWWRVESRAGWTLNLGAGFKHSKGISGETLENIAVAKVLLKVFHPLTESRHPAGRVLRVLQGFDLAADPNCIGDDVFERRRLGIRRFAPRTANFDQRSGVQVVAVFVGSQLEEPQVVVLSQPQRDARED
eukprot:CAMPEP_0202092594 /NCGR_PEP_ID=MMETSP0964-20121228/48117_1 /ASSEMBLY_ACC=CAM_ASM_000500 /TAXON_ID=4773 /ORGANISM="Schizochytrium aggregatum, Strain ATCC28209" /LENGTH=202 /DNA_ID=CAMNT_0048660837 /DNA_START=335 /DNA_END=944 /DNA_ORIENTATION=+